jgi:excisionase family DNA binding protein
MVTDMTPSEYGLVKALYGVNETMVLLSIGRTSLYELVKRGELKPAKLGKKTLFYATDLAALLTKLREPNAVPQLRGTSEIMCHTSERRKRKRAGRRDVPHTYSRSGAAAGMSVAAKRIGSEE